MGARRGRSGRILGRLASLVKARAKAAKAEVPDDATAKATAAAIMRSDKPKAQALVAQYRAEWLAKSTDIGDLI